MYNWLDCERGKWIANHTGPEQYWFVGFAREKIKWALGKPLIENTFAVLIVFIFGTIDDCSVCLRYVLPVVMGEQWLFSTWRTEGLSRWWWLWLWSWNDSPAFRQGYFQQRLWQLQLLLFHCIGQHLPVCVVSVWLAPQLKQLPDCHAQWPKSEKRIYILVSWKVCKCLCSVFES